MKKKGIQLLSVKRQQIRNCSEKHVTVPGYDPYWETHSITSVSLIVVGQNASFFLVCRVCRWCAVVCRWCAVRKNGIKNTLYLLLKLTATSIFHILPMVPIKIDDSSSFLFFHHHIGMFFWFFRKTCFSIWDNSWKFDHEAEVFWDLVKYRSSTQINMPKYRDIVHTNK